MMVRAQQASTLLPRGSALVALAFLVLTARAWCGPILYVDPTTDWDTVARGKWAQRVDRRYLRAMRHPWTPPSRGDFVMATRRLRVPRDWQGPVHLSFYCSDDVEGSPDHPLHNHRLKQVLINDTVVWERDVLDPIPEGTPDRVRVTLDVQPGDAVSLALLVYDREGAPEVPSASGESEPAPFMTHVYWGDITLEDGANRAKDGQRPVIARVEERHRTRWPLPDFGGGWDARSARLDVVQSAPIPKEGMPARAGLPMPAGKVHELRDVRLQTADERAVYSDKRELARWPDGSLKWVLFDFWMKPDWKTLDLAFRRDWAEAPGSMSVDEQETEVRLGGARSSGTTLRTGEGFLTLGDGFDVSVHGAMLLRDDSSPAAVTHVRVAESGKATAALAADGFFALDSGRQVPFSLHVQSYAPAPIVQLRWRIFNDTGEVLPISALRLALTTQRPYEALRFPGQTVAPEAPLSFVQSGPREATLNGSPVALESPLFVTWGDMAVIPRLFDLRHPSAFTARPGELTVDFIAGGNSPVVLTPGEASTHELWLAVGSSDARSLALHVTQPLALSSPAYFCATGVLGPAAPWPAQSTSSSPTRPWGDAQVGTGVRHYPDVPYLRRPSEWCNNYYARALGFWSAWVITGDGVWRRRAQDTGEHLLDTAIIHGPVPGRDWQGAMHGPGQNHVAGPWPPTLRIGGLELHQKFTGQPGALESILSVADYCARTRPGLTYRGQGSIRYLAGPLDTLATGYWETGETGFLDAGAAYVSEAKSRMDWRRGVWNDTHGESLNRGNIPWMAGQLGRSLYWWYRLTGDTEAAQILVALAESVAEENTDWDKAGEVSAYSYHPRYPASPVYYPFVLPLLFAGNELSGDDALQEGAVAAWKTWAASDAYPGNDIGVDQAANTLWMLPWIAHYGYEFGLLLTERADE